MEFKIFDESDKQIYSQDIIDMLRESDGDFVPPLSARGSTLDSDLTGAAVTHDGVLSYYKSMNEQKILGAVEEGELVAFVSFRENFTSELIGKDTLPNIYVSTLVMRPSARGRGLTGIMYDHLFNICYPERAVFTRTWSTNAAHTKILSRFGFFEIKRMTNDRGVGIDTVYYKKEAVKALTTV